MDGVQIILHLVQVVDYYKKCRMTVNNVEGKIVTLCGDDKNEEGNLLEIVFQNGILMKDNSLEVIRERSNI